MVVGPVIVVAPSFRVPAVTLNDVMTMLSNAFCGESLGSLKPKSPVVKVWVLGFGNDLMTLIVLSRPIGRSLTLVTLIAIDLAVGSVSAPLLAVPPSSWTWNVKPS